MNWSEIRTLEGRGAYLYNPKGEMVAIIFEQDRPEAEGLTAQIMESLNAQLIADHAPAEITVDAGLLTATKAMILLVEDYEAKTCKVIRAAITIGKSDWQAEAKERELAMHKMFEFLDVLRAALKAAGGGK